MECLIGLVYTAPTLAFSEDPLGYIAKNVQEVVFGVPPTALSPCLQDSIPLYHHFDASVGACILLLGGMYGLYHRRKNMEEGGTHLLSISPLELAEHKSSDSCWIAIDGGVYDVTEYLRGKHHPGGNRMILKRGGTDVSEEDFMQHHYRQGWEHMKDSLQKHSIIKKIGRLVTDKDTGNNESGGSEIN